MGQQKITFVNVALTNIYCPLVYPIGSIILNLKAYDMIMAALGLS